MTRRRAGRTARSLQVAGAAATLIAVYLFTTAAPSVAVPQTATVAPNGNVPGDGSSVTVHAENFPAQTVLIAAMCAHGATTSADCDGQSADTAVQTNASGVYDNPNFPVFKWDTTGAYFPSPNPFPSNSMNCDANRKCDVYIGLNLNDFNEAHCLVPIEYAPNAAPANPAADCTNLSVAPTTTTTAPATSSTTGSGATTTTTTGSTTTTSGSGTTTTTSGSGTTTTTSGSATTTTTTSSGSTTTSTAPGATTTSTASTTTTTGPLGSGFGVTSLQLPAGGGAEVASDTAPLSAAAGQSVTVAGRGFGPNQELPVEFRSRPQLVGTTRSDATGAYSTSVTIPASAAPGQHRIVVSGLSPTGVRIDSVTFVTVTAATAAAPSAVVQLPIVTGTLPLTGAGLAPWLALFGLVALFVGSVARRKLLGDQRSA